MFSISAKFSRQPVFELWAILNLFFRRFCLKVCFRNFARPEKNHNFAYVFNSGEIFLIASFHIQRDFERIFSDSAWKSVSENLSQTKNSLICSCLRFRLNFPQCQFSDLGHFGASFWQILLESLSRQVLPERKPSFCFFVHWSLLPAKFWRCLRFREVLPATRVLDSAVC